MSNGKNMPIDSVVIQADNNDNDRYICIYDFYYITSACILITSHHYKKHN